MRQWIKEVARGKKGAKDLTYEEAVKAAEAVSSGEATDAQVAAFLVAQRLKTESSDEVLAFLQSFQEKTAKLPLLPEIRQRCIDLAGPYTGRDTFAATIPAALLLAEAGIPVYLHSSDSLPPRNGTSLKAILSGLGIQTELSAEAVADSINTMNIGFGWTDKFCPPLAAIRHVREEIGVRTLFNTVEKLLNPGESYGIMVGVFHKTVIDVIAGLIRESGYEKGFVVQGGEGSEDLPVHRKSFLYEITKDDTQLFHVDPADYGLKHSKDAAKDKLTLQEQVTIIRAILEGEEPAELKYYRDQVLLNTGIRYYLFRMTASIEAGIELTDRQLREQQGARRLDNWRNR
ncbi:anthranilate phosphoribosyltransferase [Evansella caseinilytica]|uniref:Anthranilate phosphoribosyltransferase n=1 Tax=Evansella caseinilytica TaxID=1503961 RepID=A0A1H3RZJ0_9BACI|nr:glycosyl transferase [Evansella caseinilytica]SDZ30651.1 anthranilate phosphoribosyltransferase [Evansella caseinilytica]